MLLALLTLSAFVAPSVARQDEASLRAGLSELEPLIAKADWRALGQAAQALLEAHADQPYVWLHLPDLRDALQMARFHSDYRAPRWEELTSGELLSYNENSGSLKLRYTPRTVADFSKLEFNDSRGPRSTLASALHKYAGLYVHPAHFHGDYSVELRGKALERSVELVFFLNDGEVALVSSGSRIIVNADGSGPRAPATVRTLRGDVWTQNAQRDESPCVTREPFALKFSVGLNKLSVAYKGRPLISAEKTSGSFGRFALTSMSGVEEVLVQGRAQTSWLQSKRDEHLDKAWQKQFAASAAYRVLPEPLRPLFHEYRHPLRWDRFPRPTTDRARALVEKLEKVNALGLAALLEEIKNSPDAQLDACIRDWLTTLAMSLGGFWGRASEACEKVVEEEPRFAPALHLGAYLKSRMQRYDEAASDLRAALVIEPDNFDALADLARLLLDLKRYEEFDRLLLERAARGGITETLDRINASRLRAQRGPRWAQSHTLETERYRIVSDIDLKTCRETAQMLEESLKRFEARLRPAPRERVERFTAYVFSGRAGYTRYASDALDFGAQHTAGLYSRNLRQLLVWNQPSRAEMFETIRHEAFHQYMHRLSDDAPVWLNEGLAECFENAQFQRGPSEELRSHPEHLRPLGSTRFSAHAIERFIRVTPAEFYSDGGLNYARGWALTHFLMNSTPGWRRCLDRMLDKIVERAPESAVVDAGFDGVDFEKLAEQLARHLESLER